VAEWVMQPQPTSAEILQHLFLLTLQKISTSLSSALGKAKAMV